MSETVLAGRGLARNSRSVMSSSRRYLVCLATYGALLGGCFGGQTGQEDRPQAVVDCMFERVGLQAGESTPLGFSAGELEAELAGQRVWPLSWSRMGTATQLTMELREVRARTLSTSEVETCADTVDLEVLIAISTEDGLLEEELLATVSAQALAVWSLSAQLAFDEIAGELDAADLDLDLSNWRAPRLSLRLSRDAAVTGSITLDGEDPNPNDSEVPTSAIIAELPGQ